MPAGCYETEYKNYGKCVCLETEQIKLMATLDFGPRIIYFGLKDEENILFEDIDRNFEMDVDGFGKWYAYGGHRIWLAPEVIPETYYPDNSKVTYSFENNTLSLSQTTTAFGKQFSISCKVNNDDSVDITNIIKNNSDRPQSFAPWSVTGLAPGGTEYISLNDSETGFLPNRTIALWPYTNLNDKRFTLTDTNAVLRQDSNALTAFKAGFNITCGQVKYIKGNQIFTKEFDKYNTNFTYPDFACNFETYTNKYFLECELLGNLKEYQPGENAVINEKWRIAKTEE